MSFVPSLNSAQSNQGTATNADIEQAIISSIAYSDVFDFAVTLQEVHRFLHYVACSFEQMTMVMTETELCHGRISTDGTYYCLTGREACLAERHTREARAVQKLVTARSVGRMLSNVPNVRMVALSGSLAARNSTPGDDIDIFCVTDQGKLWRTRALLLFACKFDTKVLRRNICANYFRSMAVLELDVKSMYMAHELAQMVPMYGLDVYHEMRNQNLWTNDFLPNAQGAPAMTQDIAVSPNTRIKSTTEWAMDGGLGAWLEKFESKRKIERFNASDFYDEPHEKFTTEKTGQRTQMGEWIEQEWQSRVTRIGSVVDTRQATTSVAGASTT